MDFVFSSSSFTWSQSSLLSIWEFRVVGYEQTSDGKARLQLATKSGATFHAVMVGGKAAGANVLRQGASLIGKLATVRYQELTGSRQVPRFPRVVAIDKWAIE